MKNTKNKIAFLGSFLSLSALPLVTLSCAKEQETPKNFETKWDGYKAINAMSIGELEKFDNKKSLEFNPAHSQAIAQANSYYKNVLQVVEFVVNKNPQAKQLQDEILKQDQMNKYNLADLRLNLSFQIVKLLISQNQNNGLGLDEKHTKIFDDLIKTIEKVNSYTLWNENTFITTLAQRTLENYYNNSNKTIQDFVTKANTINQVETEKLIIDQQSIKNNEQLATEFTDKIFPLLREKAIYEWDENLGRVLYRQFDNNSLNYLVNNLGGKKVVLASNKENPVPSGISSSGALYIPDAKGKLGTIDPKVIIAEYKKALELSKKTKAEIEKKAEDKRSDEEKHKYAVSLEEIRYYEKLLKDLSQPEVWFDTNLLAPHLQHFDLVGKYILKFTVNKPLRSPRFPEINYGISSVVINGSQQKIFVKIEVATISGRIYPKSLAQFSTEWPVRTTNEKVISNDVYIIVDAEKFNASFNGSKNLDNVSNLNLDLSDIIELI
ncbi:hypothetical protein [Mycoplasmopsis alligatoris]|uniref:Lipoprotein n=1 Tax=Mycoplasmopsis alligatoris A21JP2 TaxID=747682 RepID=D4XW78_9BACT|nr:hypothetical protein [Mycoplasmopsis alligatoris]EFF41397.1 hypothetical protein MALL_0741 [Mycoplasmopsis alligatoris A21JP2]